MRLSDGSPIFAIMLQIGGDCDNSRSREHEMRLERNAIGSNCNRALTIYFNA